MKHQYGHVNGSRQHTTHVLLSCCTVTRYRYLVIFHQCVRMFFTLNRSFYPLTSSTPSVSAGSSSQGDTSSVVANYILRITYVQIILYQYSYLCTRYIQSNVSRRPYRSCRSMCLTCTINIVVSRNRGPGAFGPRISPWVAGLGYT